MVLKAVPRGYFVEASIDIVSLRHALGRFNLARLPSKTTPVLFRYREPRIMRVFLHVAHPEQSARLFEWVEAADGSFDAVADRSRG